MNYIWICSNCGKKVKWNGIDKKPDTSCEGALMKKHKRIQMPLKEMPKK